MPADAVFMRPIVRRVYEGRLVSICFDSGEPVAIALGDLAACVPGFEMLPEMRLHRLLVIHRCTFVPITTACEWAAMYERHRIETPRQGLIRLLRWAEKQEVLV